MDEKEGNNLSDIEHSRSTNDHEDITVAQPSATPAHTVTSDDTDTSKPLTLPVLLSALFLGTSFTGPIMFGFVLVTPILVQLAQRVGGSDISFWIPSGWGAAAAVGFSVAGRISDIFGRRPVILSGQVLTIVGGVVACTAQSMEQVIAGEVVLGMAIGTVSVAYAGITEILPNKFRGVGLAWTEFNLATWAVPSTILANVFVSNASWRIMFYICIGYGAFSLIGTFLVYFPPSHLRPDNKTKWQQFKELDFVGAFLFTAGLIVFLYGLNSGGKTYAWSSSGTVAPLVLGVAVFGAAFVYDALVPEDPLFPWYLIREFRRFSALVVLVFVAGMVFFAASALNAQTILYLFTADPIKIGIYSLASGFGQLIGGVAIPALVHYIKHVHYQLAFAVFMQTLFFGVAALTTPTRLNWLMAVQFLAMFPFGWITLNCYTTASLNVPQRDLGVAIGIIGTFRSVGGSVGSVIFSSIFEQTAEHEVPKRIIETAAVGGIYEATTVKEVIERVRLTLVGARGQDTSQGDVSAALFSKCVTAARYAYAYSFRVTWLASIPFGFLAILAAIAVRDPSRHFTNHVEVKLRKKT